MPLDIVMGIKAGNGKLLLNAAPLISLGLNGTYAETEVETITGLGTATNSYNLPITIGGSSAILKRMAGVVN